MYAFFWRTFATFLSQERNMTLEQFKNEDQFSYLRESSGRILGILKEDEVLSLSLLINVDGLHLQQDKVFRFQLDMYQEWNLIEFQEEKTISAIGMIEHGRYYRSQEMIDFVKPHMAELTQILRTKYLREIENPNIGFFVVKTSEDLIYGDGTMKKGTRLTVYSNSLYYVVKDGVYSGKEVSINSCRVVRKIVEDEVGC